MERPSNFIDKYYIRIRNQYFLWLCSIVCKDLDYRNKKTIKDTYGKDTYWYMLRVLGKTEFYSIIDKDDNRAGDGLYLRESFVSECGYGDEEYKIINAGPCSVLEMLVALSKRLADIQSVLSHEDLFWIMCKNLEINKDDLHIDLDDVKQKIDVFLSRKYKKDGKGGLFPLKKYVNDQTSIEIWVQANAWIMENLPKSKILVSSLSG